jgi:hypothetical protein
VNLRSVIFFTTAMIFVACSVEPSPEANVKIASEEPTAVSARDPSAALPDGAYLIEGVTVTEDGEVSHYTRDQIKIYSKGRFMYAFQNTQTDSIDVGAGNATWSNGVMVEVPRVNHDGPVSGYSFDVAIEQTATGFEQTIKGMPYEGGRLLDMVEVWNTASTARSPFDGLWALEAREFTDPKVTGFTETKMIGGGHFIWLQNVVYEGQKGQDFGFGSFSVDAEGNAVETALVSSLENYAGTVNAVTMRLIDENHFSQSFIYNDDVITQSYVRM